MALALFAAACGSSAEVASDETAAADVAESESSDSGSDSAESEDESSDGDDASSESGDPWENYTSPIQEFLGVDFSNFDDEDFQQQLVEQQQEAEEAVAVCMRELGWEYTPVDQSQFLDFSTDGLAGPDGLEFGSDEWVAKYGLGITTQAFAQSEVGPDLVGFDDSKFEESDSSIVDPNEEYVSSLGPAEQEAYFADLHGDFPEFDETLTEEEQNAVFDDFEPTGCQAEAFGDGGVFGSEAQTEFFETFGDDLDDLYTRVESDPRIVAEQGQLVDCLAGSGHTISADEDPWFQFSEMFEPELDALFGSDESFDDEPFDEESFEDPFEGVDPETLSEEEIDAILSEFNSGPSLNDEQLATLADLQQRELDLAADVLECEPGFFSGQGVSEVFFEVLAEYEQEFLDTNASAIAEFEGAGAQ